MIGRLGIELGLTTLRGGLPNRFVNWSRAVPTAAAVTGTDNNTTATAELLSQAITGNSFRTIGIGATGLYEFDKPETTTDTLVVWEFSAGVAATDYTILLQKWNGVGWDTVVTWASWITAAGVSLAGKADVIKLDAGTHDAAGKYRLSIQNNAAVSRSIRTPQLYRWPTSGVPPMIHVVGASIMDGDTRWARWIAQCAPLGIDVICVNFGASGMECQGIGDNVARWHSVDWRPDMQWVVQHAGGNNVSPTRPWSGLSPAQIADIQARLDYLMAQYPNPQLALPACITFRDYVAPNPVMDGVYEERGSLPYNDNIWIPTIAADFPHAMNTDGRPIMDFYNLVFNNEEAWLSDGIHMNGTGGAAFDNWICDRWLRYVRRQSLPFVTLTNPYRAATALVAACEATPNQTTFTAAHDAVQLLPNNVNGGRVELLTRLALLGFPVRVTLPSILGTGVLGATVYAETGLGWTGDPTTIVYSWLRDGVVIPGAISNAYVITADDVGHYLSRKEVATNALGSGASTSLSLAIAAAQSPADIGDVRLWLDATDASTFTFSSGAVVSQWRDKSGNGYHASQADVARQPTRRTAPGDGMWEVVADNSNDGMTLDMPPVAAQTEELDLFVLTGDAPDIGFGGYIASANPDGVSNRHHYIFTWEDGTNPFVNDIVGGINIGIRQSEIAAAGFTVDYTKPILFQSSTPLGGTATLRVNNGFSKNGSVGAIDTSANIWTIFCRPPIAGNPSAGPIRQAIIFNKVLSDTQRTALWNWLRLNHIAPLPVNTSLPGFTGTLGRGFVLTSTPGVWTGAITIERQWLRNGAPILGAIETTYTLQAADDGTTITFREIGINATGAYAAISAGQYIVPSLAPNEISNLKIWLDATDAATFTYGTAPAVSQWADKSGNGHHAVQASAANQPTRRQSPTDNEWEVLADGVNDYFTIPTMPTILTSAACEVVVLAGANSDNQGALIALSDSGSGNRHLYLFNWEDGTNPWLNINFGGMVHQRSLTAVTTAYPTFNRLNPIAYAFGNAAGGTGARLRINNVYDTGTLSMGVSDTTLSTWTMFCRNPPPGFAGTGPIRQIIIYDRQLTTNERAALHQWMRLHGQMP